MNARLPGPGDLWGPPTCNPNDPRNEPDDRPMEALSRAERRDRLLAQSYADVLDEALDAWDEIDALSGALRMTAKKTGRYA